MNERLPSQASIEHEQPLGAPASRAEMVLYLKGLEQELRSSVSYHSGVADAVDGRPRHEARVLGLTDDKLRELLPVEIQEREGYRQHADEWHRFALAAEMLASQLNYIPDNASNSQKESFSSTTIDSDILTQYANALMKAAGKMPTEVGSETDRYIARSKAESLDAAAELATSLAENYEEVMKDISRAREARTVAGTDGARAA